MNPSRGRARSDRRGCRRRALAVAPIAVVVAALAGCGESNAPAQLELEPPDMQVTDYASLPGLHPSGVQINLRRPGRARGLVFVAPKQANGKERPGEIQAGPMIVDDRGRIRWFQAKTGGETATDLRVQRYRGKPVLTFWQGRGIRGQGDGQCILLDTSYRRIAAVGNKNLDLHECQLTERGTMLTMRYENRPADLRAVGGERDDRTIDGIVEEVDVETGEILFRWSALDHIGLDESYQPIDKRYEGNWDYFHINSVTEDSDGDLLISARHTWAVYKVDRETGRVIWRLGGKRSDFPLRSEQAKFAWQHDARPAGPDRVRIFDNDSGEQPVRPHSQIVTYELDPKRRTAAVVELVEHPRRLSSDTQGNAQRLPNGNLFVGWGSAPHFSEFDRKGRLVFDGRVTQASDNYRAFRFPWVGRPETQPSAATAVGGRGTIVRVSWNGATEVVRWRVLAGPERDALQPVLTRPWNGLETRIDAPTRARFIAVQALDRHGAVIGTSSPVERRR